MKKTAIKHFSNETFTLITQLNSEKDCEVRKKVQPYWYYSRTQKARE